MPRLSAVLIALLGCESIAGLDDFGDAPLAAGGSGSGGVGAGAGGSSGATPGGQGVGCESATAAYDVAIANGEHDGMWSLANSVPLEHYHWEDAGDPPQRYLVVSDDNDHQSTGFRFAVDLPASVVLGTVRLEIRVEGGNYEVGGDSMYVSVFDDSDVPAFDEQHDHTASEHARQGFAPALDVSWELTDEEIQASPNLAKQLRHVLDRQDWEPNGVVGFVLKPNVMPDRYVRITDFDAGPSARLLIDYCP